MFVFWVRFFQRAGKPSQRMNFSICYNSVLSLKNLLNTFNPVAGFHEFARDIKTGIKLTKFTSQRNYLEKLVPRGECTPEVQTLARRRYSTLHQNTRRYKAEERRIMMFRIQEKNWQIRNLKKEWTNISKNVEGNFNQAGRALYREIKRKELNRVWKLEKEHKAGKLNRLPTLPENFQGILVGDEALEAEFGNEEVEPIILGGIENDVSQDVKEFLKISLKYRIFPRLKRRES